MYDEAEIVLRNELVNTIEAQQTGSQPRQVVVFSDFLASKEVTKQWLAFLRLVYPRSWVTYIEDGWSGKGVLILTLYGHYTTAGLRVACRVHGIEGDFVGGVF